MRIYAKKGVIMILQLAQCILVLVAILFPVAIVIIRQQGKEM